MISTKPNTTSGFTLIETLVAIAILTIAIVGPYSIANTAIVTSRTSQNEMVASYLAQEGIEFVHAVRDDNFLARLVGVDSGRWWMLGLDACLWGAECTVDPTSGQINQCPWNGDGYTCPPLFLSENGLYNQQYEGQETPFTRSVRITDRWWDTAQMTVSVTVSWEEREGPRSYTLEENLYDWLGYGN